MNEYGMGDAPPQMKTWYSVRWEYGRKDFFTSFQEAFSFYIEQIAKMKEPRCKFEILTVTTEVVWSNW
jgi:hypothetical protein